MNPITTLSPKLVQAAPGRITGDGLLQEWPFIQWHFQRCIKRTTYVTVGTTLPDGQPNVTAIGSFMLNADLTGYYLEKFTSTVQRCGGEGTPISVLGVDPGRGFWLKSIFKGQFQRPPAVRLRGVAGPLREPRPGEKERFLRLIRPLRRFKGYELLWADMNLVREISFSAVEYVRLGKMSPRNMANWS